MLAQSKVESKTGRKGRVLSKLWRWSSSFSINRLHQQVQQTMKRAVESFIDELFGILINLVVASLFIFSMAILAVASLLCLVLEWQTAAIVFGIALLSVTLVARNHRWSQKLDPVDPETLDLIIAAEVAYLVLIKQGFTIFNCFVISSAVTMAYLLPYR